MEKDNTFMSQAIQLALLAEQEGNLPVGAVIAFNGDVVAEGKSAVWVPKFDATRHAEMKALRAVPSSLWKYASEMSLYTTLEPCFMCFGSILLHRIGRVVYGATDNYGGTRSITPYLSPFFKERKSNTEWIGPIMPQECDPLHERLLALEEDRKREI